MPNPTSRRVLVDEDAPVFDVLDEMERYQHHAECVHCGGDLVALGSLGNLEWFRCRHCGADQSLTSEVSGAEN